MTVVMDVDLRLRLFLLYLRFLGRGATGPLTPAEVEQLRSATVPQNRLARAVFGARQPGVAVRDLDLPGSAGSIPVRVYRPAGIPSPAPVAVLFHGGGWAVGSLDSYDAIASRVAAEAGVVVVSVDYRLAPDHPYPHGLDDAYDATAWVAQHGAELGVDPQRLAVMGDSAGGNLAAVVCLRAREEGGPAIRHQTLAYPVTDVTERQDIVDAIAAGGDQPVLSERMLRGFRDFYLGDADDTDPYVSPLLASDLSGLPPALVITAEHDPLRGQGLEYGDALAAAGVPTRVTDYVRMTHGFLSFPGVARSAPQAFAEITRELRRALFPQAHRDAIAGTQA